MPPNTLIGFLTALTALVFQLLTMNQKRAGMHTNLASNSLLAAGAFDAHL